MPPRTCARAAAMTRPGMISTHSLAEQQSAFGQVRCIERAASSVFLMWLSGGTSRNRPAFTGGPDCYDARCLGIKTSQAPPEAALTTQSRDGVALIL